MKCSTKLQKTLVLSIFVAICTIGSVQAADDALLKMLPGDCAFCVRINDLSGSIAKMDQYLAGVAPIGTAMLVNKQLADIVGDPMLTGIEMNGTFAVIGLSDTKTVGMLIPMTNYAEFVKTNPNCKPGENGITLLSAPNSTNIFAMTEAAGGKYALVVPEDEKMNLATLKTALSKTSGSLAGKLNAAQAQEAVDAPIWGYVNLALLYEKFSPEVMAEMEKAEQEVSSPKMSGTMGEFAAFYIKIYKEMFKEFAGDADSATLALTPGMTALSIDTTLRAKDGSELAQMLTEDPKTGNAYTLTGYLDNNNAINGLMKIDQTSLTKMYDKIFDILEKSKTDASLTEQVAKMKTLTHKMMPAMGDEIAFSFSYAAGKPPFKIREVFTVKDMAAMKEATKDAMGLAGDFYSAMGLPMNFEYKANTGTYKNATLDKIVLTFPPSDDPNDPMQTAIKQMYGDNLTYTLAHSDTTYYVTMGEGHEADIKTLIDQNAAAPATGETKAAIDLLKNTPYNDFVCSVNVIKLITGLSGLMQGMGPMLQTGCDGAMSPIPDIFGGLNVPTQSSLAIGGKIVNGQIGMRMILPKQHLTEIFSATMQIQQKMMPKQIAQPVQQSAPATTSAPAPTAPAPSK